MKEFYLEEGIDQIVKEFNDAGCPSISNQTIQERRAGYIASTSLAGQSRELYSVHTIRCEYFSLKLFKPSAKENLPVVIYFHGGCFVSGSFETHDQQLREIAIQSQALVVAVEYRLAPEFQYPAAHDDAFNASNYIYHNCCQWGGRQEDIVIAGDSAGGNLALVTCLRLKSAKEWLPKKQILIYPMLDATASSNSFSVNGANFIITKEALLSGFDSYIEGTGVTQANQEISPIFSGDFDGLPETHIITAEYDPLVDEGEWLYKKLISSGVHAQCRRYLGVIHGFFQLSGISKAARESIQYISRVIATK
ncbi:alpha/beta hydrolase [Shewanella sp. 202IG2-18]|uniref:alpha/beta hydrolase n=1 Tax=Parashewanella hymeniacidonis TaxID=2807618 RepID=UPI001961D2AF|nr:alpha/beta hydrolase [Parashewanella hymeniacidonis]MBM7073752.1 alpha/beta hydrolase [Parashewanella hymeniacidonis]